MKGIAIGDYIAVRNIQPLLDGAKTLRGRQYLWQAINRRIELEGFILLTVVRVSTMKYRIDEIFTEDDSAVLDDNEITFTADWYDIKRFSAAVKTTYYNDLFGEQEEYRIPDNYGEVSA